jgi:hypothetical protein
MDEREDTAGSISRTCKVFLDEWNIAYSKK